MTSHIVSFLTGVLFAVGLAISGMTQPHKIISFLDVTGTWDASLIFVMVGAILVYFVGYRLVTRKPTPLLAKEFFIPNKKDITMPLVLGSALFGLGWGASGFCPGPAIVSLVTGKTSVLLFVACMLLGMWIQQNTGKKG